MIAAPARLGALPRGPAAPAARSAAGTVPPPEATSFPVATPPPGSDGGSNGIDGQENPLLADETDIANRIAELVARSTTPADEALEKQRTGFDIVIRVQAEAEREINALRDLAIEQIKHDDELLKKWIAMI